MIEAFIQHFGRISEAKLYSLNKTLSIQLSFAEDDQTGAGGLSSPVNPVGSVIDDNENETERKESTLNIPDSPVRSQPQMGIRGNKDDADGDMTEEAKDMQKLSLMIRDMSKYSILISFGMISTFIIAIITLIYGARESIDSKLVENKNDEMTFYLFTNIFVLIDSGINTLCLCLQFNFNRNYYFQLCGGLHKYCESRYTTDINNDLKRSTTNVTDHTFLQIGKIDRQGTIGVRREHAPEDEKVEPAISDMTQFSRINVD